MTNNGNAPNIPPLTREQQQYLDQHGPLVFAYLAQQCIADSEAWFGDSPIVFSLVHHALAICGETGEFANLVKKIDRGSLKYEDAKTRFDLVMENADVTTYLFNILGILNANGYKAYQRKRAINIERFTKQRQEREASHG